MSTSTKYVIDDFGLGSFSAHVFDFATLLLLLWSLFSPIKPYLIYCPQKTFKVREFVPDGAFIEPIHSPSAYYIVVANDFVTYDEPNLIDSPYSGLFSFLLLSPYYINYFTLY